MSGNDHDDGDDDEKGAEKRRRRKKGVAAAAAAAGDDELSTMKEWQGTKCGRAGECEQGSAVVAIRVLKSKSVGVGTMLAMSVNAVAVAASLNGAIRHPHTSAPHPTTTTLRTPAAPRGL